VAGWVAAAVGGSVAVGSTVRIFGPGKVQASRLAMTKAVNNAFIARLFISVSLLPFHQSGSFCP